MNETVERLKKPPTPMRRDPMALTPRQQEVAALLLQGMVKAKQIAQSLGVSAVQARHHLDEIRSKLHAENNTQAAQILASR